MVWGWCRHRNGKWMRNLLSLLNADLLVSACESFFVCVHELILSRARAEGLGCIHVVLVTYFRQSPEDTHIDPYTHWSPEDSALDLDLYPRSRRFVTKTKRRWCNIQTLLNYYLCQMFNNLHPVSQIQQSVPPTQLHSHSQIGDGEKWLQQHLLL